VLVCTDHFVTVSLNLTYLHCLHYSFFEHHFNLYFISYTQWKLLPPVFRIRFKNVKSISGFLCNVIRCLTVDGAGEWYDLYVDPLLE